MSKYEKPTTLFLHSTILLISILGNFIFSAVFILFTGFHLLKASNTEEESIQLKRQVKKEERSLTFNQMK